MTSDRVHQAELERLLVAAAAGNGAIPAASAEIILGDKEKLQHGMVYDFVVRAWAGAV